MLHNSAMWDSPHWAFGTYQRPLIQQHGYLRLSLVGERHLQTAKHSLDGDHCHSLLSK